MFLLPKFLPLGYSNDQVRLLDLRVYVFTTKGLAEELQLHMEFRDPPVNVCYQMLLANLVNGKREVTWADMAQDDAQSLLDSGLPLIVNLHARSMEGKLIVRVVPKAMVMWRPEEIGEKALGELTLAERDIYENLLSELSRIEDRRQA